MYLNNYAYMYKKHVNYNCCATYFVHKTVYVRKSQSITVYVQGSLLIIEPSVDRLVQDM